MASTSDTNYEAARAAAQKIFSDTSVSPRETRNSLEALKDEIETWIETLPTDDEE